MQLSSLLAALLEEEAQRRPDRVFAEKAMAVAELSRLFTKGRQALGTDYLQDTVLADAYLSYFFPVNLSKVRVLLDELPADWPNTALDRPLRVLDLGSGPATGGLAVLDWLNQHQSASLEKLTVVAVDASAEALRQAKRLWTACAGRLGMSATSLVAYEGDLAGPKSDIWRDHVRQRGSYDLIIVANCLNEMYCRTHYSIDDSSELLSDLLTHLATQGTLMIVEPALRETSRALHQLRDRLLAENRCTVYSPCLHDKNCPALLDPDDWCHEERAWEPPITVQQIDREVGFIKDALKFSYLLLRTDGRTIADRSPDTFRVVSELRMLKGDTRAWLCNELGRTEVGRLDRTRSASNAAWDQCQRGTIIRIDGLKRKDGAALNRIPADGTAEIVRPI